MKRSRSFLFGTPKGFNKSLFSCKMDYFEYTFLSSDIVLGFDKSSDNAYVTISSVEYKRFSPELKKVVKEGDTIIAVNEKDVSNFSCEIISDMLRESNQPLNIKFARSRDSKQSAWKKVEDIKEQKKGGLAKTRVKKRGEHLFFEDAEAGLVENVRGYIDAGINIECLDAEKRTVLHRAAIEGHIEIVKVVLSHCKKLKFINKVDKYGNTALYCACLKQKTASALICKILLENGANPCPHKKTTGMTPLHWAAYNGDLEITRILLDMAGSKGARAVMLLNKDKKSPIDVAGERYISLAKHRHIESDTISADNLETKQFQDVISRMINVVIPHPKHKKRSNSPLVRHLRTNLFWAAAIGNCGTVKSLLSMGVDPTYPNPVQNHQCSLHVAVLMGELGILKILINACNELSSFGADISQKDKMWNTALHVACGCEAGLGANHEAVKHLLEAEVPADDSIRNRYGHFAYDYATNEKVKNEMLRSKFTRDKKLVRDSPRAIWVLEVENGRLESNSNVSVFLNAFQGCPLLTLDHWESRFNHRKTSLIAIYVLSKDVLKLAERQRFEIRLLESGIRKPFTRNKTHLFEPLRSRDAAQIVRSTIENLIDVRAYLLSGTLLSIFPLHHTEEMRDMQFKWLDPKRFYYPFSHLGAFFYEGQTCDVEALDSAANYLGEKRAMYMSWLSHYTSWLAILVVPGLILCVYQSIQERAIGSIETHWAIWYAAFVALWGTLIVEKWKRKQFELAYKWDMMDFEEEEHFRPDFHGDESVSPVTGEIEKFYPSRYRIAREVLQMPALFLFVGVVIITFVSILAYRTLFSSHEFAQVHNMIASVCNGASITLLNHLYNTMAKKFTDLENHRTDSEYEKALIFKTFLFQFVNSNIAIAYTAFFNRDYLSTNLQVSSVIISKQAIDIVTSSIIPMVANSFRRVKYQAATTKLRARYSKSMYNRQINNKRENNAHERNHSVAPGKDIIKSRPKHFVTQQAGLKAVMDLYTAIDEDGSGTVSCEEIGCYLKELNEAYHTLHYLSAGSPGIERKQFRSPQHAMSHFDTNGDGWVTFAEFTHAFTKEITDADDPHVLARNECERNAIMCDDKMNLINCYSQQVIQFGWITMFSAACPIAPFLALIMNVIKIRSDVILSTVVNRRPVALGAQNIGAWLIIEEFLGLMGVISNCMLLYLAFNDVFGESKNLLPNFFSGILIIKPITFIILLVAEHTIVAMKLAIAQLIPDKPKWLEAVILRAKKNSVQVPNSPNSENLVENNKINIGNKNITAIPTINIV